MTTGATLFTGGGGVDLGMRWAGITTLWGIEYDPAIAEVARANGVPVTVADVLDADPARFERVDVLHASPPCPNFSSAKVNRRETERDVAMADAVCRFVKALTPRVFTLENVYAYRKARGFRGILETLRRAGYWYTFEHVNAADYGVPQTRMRLILRAVRYGLVSPLPAPEPWRGWYDAIADLIDELPESQLAPWQLERLPASIQSALVANGGFCDEVVMRGRQEPSFTVTANSNQTGVRALLIGDQSANAGAGVQERDADEPAMTVRAMESGGSPPRAIVKARVVAMTPRALARFQSFPDSYRLPDARGLACRVVGNAVPPLLYQRLIVPLDLPST